MRYEMDVRLRYRSTKVGDDDGQATHHSLTDVSSGGNMQRHDEQAAHGNCPSIHGRGLHTARHSDYHGTPDHCLGPGRNAYLHGYHDSVDGRLHAQDELEISDHEETSKLTPGPTALFSSSSYSD